MNENIQDSEIPQKDIRDKKSKKIKKNKFYFSKWNRRLKEAYLNIQRKRTLNSLKKAKRLDQHSDSINNTDQQKGFDWKNNALLMYTTIGLIVLLLSLIVWVALHHSNNGPNPLTNLMKINSIQAQLKSLQDTVSSTSQMDQQEQQVITNQLQVMDRKLSQISERSGASNDNQMRQLQSTLQSDQTDLSQKMDAMSQEISQIKQKVFPPATLSESALPFTVVSIDPWNGEPYAEIVQRNNSSQVSYVGLYEIAGGWKVIDINAAEQTVTFVNVVGQVVHIHVKSF